MTERLRRHEEEICYVEYAAQKAKGHQKKDLDKHLRRMLKQRLEYRNHINGSKKVEK